MKNSLSYENNRFLTKYNWNKRTTINLLALLWFENEIPLHNNIVPIIRYIWLCCLWSLFKLPGRLKLLDGTSLANQANKRWALIHSILWLSNYYKKETLIISPFIRRKSQKIHIFAILHWVQTMDEKTQPTIRCRVCAVPVTICAEKWVDWKCCSQWEKHQERRMR